jgi:hypothetical protein
MRGEKELPELLADLRPTLHEDEFVFASLSRESLSGLPSEPLASFREEEGVSVILRRPDAEAAGIAYDYPCRLITLAVHSSLHAVGLMAAVAARLTNAGISVNPVSAYHHDHLFVPTDRAREALLLLAGMQSTGGPSHADTSPA